MKSSIVLGTAYLVFWSREMVQPDVAIAAFGQSANRTCKDAKLLRAFGQELREAALLLLHPRHVSIAEDRNSIRVHSNDLVDRIAEAFSRLMRQSVDQIDV